MTVNKIMFGLFKFAKIIITSKVNVMDGTDERMPEKYNHFRIHRDDGMLVASVGQRKSRGAG